MCVRYFGAVLIVLALAVRGAGAQELEPRAYTNTPVGLNFLIMGYGYTEGGVATDASLPLKDAELEIHSAVVAYVRSLDVLGMSGKFDVILPYAWVSGHATFIGQPREREVSGWADPRFRFSANLYGAPALPLGEFAGYQQDFIVGASLQVSVPIGQYEADKLVNIGTNRWSFKGELGASKTVGPLTVDLLTCSPSFIRSEVESVLHLSR